MVCMCVCVCVYKGCFLILNRVTLNNESPTPAYFIQDDYYSTKVLTQFFH